MILTEIDVGETVIEIATATTADEADQEVGLVIEEVEAEGIGQDREIDIGTLNHIDVQDQGIEKEEDVQDPIQGKEGDVQGHEIVENMKRKPITEAMVAQGLDKSEMSRLINEANYQSRLQITFICT